MQIPQIGIKLERIPTKIEKYLSFKNLAILLALASTSVVEVSPRTCINKVSIVL